MRYKTNNYTTALALKRYWKQSFGMDITISNENSPEFWEIYPSNPEQDHPMWRELNDAVVFGRSSLSN